MNSEEANRQITQMIAFIRQEAKEKAEEIEVKTESAFMAEKLSLQTEASIKIREEFAKNQKEALIAKKIQRSKEISKARFDTMESRDKKINSLKDEVLGKLEAVEKHQQYSELVRVLIVQGLIKMGDEENVKVQCRKCDVEIVKGELEQAKAMFLKAVKEATGVAIKVTVSVDEQNPLPPPPSPERQGATCRGGVVLTARNGKVICRNTLDSRLDVVYNNLLPQVRGILFGVRPGGHSNKSEEEKEAAEEKSGH